ncbi:MAG: 50S ribosomal protein L17 [Patescibacteria group bacterium]
MKHGQHQRKFGRKTDVRRALLKGLALALIERGKIKTTAAKAKSLRPLIEKLVTRARRGDLASQRLIFSRLGHSPAIVKFIKEIGPRYAKRAGGYTRISKLPARTSDGSPLAIIEFV